MNAEQLEFLLALCNAAGHRCDQLAHDLRHAPQPLDMLRHWMGDVPPSYALPGPKHCRVARTQRLAIETLGIGVLPVWQWPDFLHAVTPTAPALFVRGAMHHLHTRGVGIVGARCASSEAQRWAYAWARHFAQQGVPIISGGAMGIDSAAHMGALDGGGATIMYFGTAVDNPYPAKNRALQHRIVQDGGALVSEHPPGERTYKGDHAKRNRWIAAQSHVLLIAEAALASGSLGTAAYAQKIGIPIEVPPDPVGGERSGIAQLLVKARATIRDWPV